MAPDDRKKAHGKDFLLASVLVVVGLLLSGISLIEIAADSPRMAQATPPLQSSPSTAPDNAPAESRPGGTRPTTPEPEPARPDDAAQTAGASSAMPSAPAEKVAPPIEP